jgi:hypothetical protein
MQLVITLLQYTQLWHDVHKMWHIINKGAVNVDILFRMRAPTGS